jgi:glycerol-3-phosphate dehydrogenase
VALGIGMKLYELLAGDRNRGLDRGVRMPRTTVASARRFRERFPDVASEGINGCASWFDAQIRDAGRLITECVADAVQAGALMLNHAEALTLMHSGDRVNGAVIRDRVSGQEHELRAALTIATLGPWATGFMRRSGRARPALADLAWTRNVNIVSKRRIVQGGAVGFFSRRQGDGVMGQAKRLYFVTPWQDTSIIGTAHEIYPGDPDTLAIGHVEVEELLREFGATLRGPALTLDDVAYVHMGLTPSEEGGASRAKRTIICDYEREQGLKGYLEVAANKLTTAPTIAAKVARHALDKLGIERSAADFSVPLPGACEEPDPVDALEDAYDADARERAWVAAIYGTRADEILKLADDQPGLDAATAIARARVMHGVREEMAVGLGDGLFRCSDLAERGRLSQAELAWCAAFMAQELGWTDDRRASEVDSALQSLRRHMSGGRAEAWSAAREPWPAGTAGDVRRAEA